MLPRVFLVLLAAGACSGRPLETTPTGAAGTGAAGSGAAETGTAGAAAPGGGAAGAAMAPPNAPLPISGSAALERAAAVLWQAAPDGSLVDQANAGDFATKELFAGAVRELLADPRARVGVGAFYRWWLGLDRLVTSDLDKDEALFPEYTPALRADMALEPQTFGVEMTLSMKASFTSLMTAPVSWVMPDVARLYGATGVSGTDQVFVSSLLGARAGLLTQPALQALGSLATRNSPSRRGTEVVSRFFCQDVPAPPPGTPGLDPIPPGTTVRAALNMDVVSAVCEACHVMIDRPGLPFEDFDAIGRARSTDNGAPVDSTVSDVLELSHDGEEVAVDGPVELATKMAADSGVQSCFALRWLEFALGHALGSSAASALPEIVGAFSSSGFDLQALIVAVLTNDAFLTP